MLPTSFGRGKEEGGKEKEEGEKRKKKGEKRKKRGKRERRGGKEKEEGEKKPVARRDPQLCLFFFSFNKRNRVFRNATGVFPPRKG